ncbi:MAG: threonine--tRNA ligase [Candidatus Hatepunaea meridiana]|nr:threonine--tRNA ligase [Candidatus Hatepunaea meridiana]
MNPNSPQTLEIFWHSSAHLLAQAVKRLYPDVKLGIGPAIKNGFYYDFDFGETISSDELPKIEAEMKRIVEEDLSITRSELSPDEAKLFFAKENQDYKLELIEELDEQISVYSQGEFTDLCRGPHIASTGLIKHFKLLSLTGAYWRGDERNQMLQRIYGIAYPTPKQLKVHLMKLEEAKKRDHRIIGKQMDLFSFHPEAPGAPFWHPKGEILFHLIDDYMRKLLTRRGYGQISSPLIMTRDLWERSGHWDHYHNNMYFTTLDDRDYAVRPMNCPGAVLMYKERQWSYRDLPLRWAEMGIVHRYEKSGTLHGLFRVRHITQDDAHIFCTPDQIVDEVSAMIKLVFEVFEHFNLTDISMELSTRPKDRIGSDELWDNAEEALITALDQGHYDYDVNKGEGAFYGPKIDFHVVDALGRSWQCSTIQLDFNFPQRFDLEYIGSDNQPHHPVMLHRTILGAMERFIGILIEHYGGDFPLWLAPEQAVLLPITDKEHDAVRKTYDRLCAEGIRCRVDWRAEKIGRKIRDAELAKVPYMLIIGAREAENDQVSLRRRGEGNLGAMSVDILIERMKSELE